MLLASLLFSMMNACVFAITRLEPDIPPSVISFVRVLCNLIILILPRASIVDVTQLFGDRRMSLWLRGLFGSLALMLSFAAITRIGPGESAFLTASSGFFVALLCPLLLRQPNSWKVWLAITGSLIGVSLLFTDDGVSADMLGRTMALLSGFLSALAYLMVARAGRSNQPESVIFYFCLVAVMIHLGYFYAFGFCLPLNPQSWALLLFAGLLGSGAQLQMTRAYQAAPAAFVSAVGYLAPVLSLLWGVLWFDQIPGRYAMLGSLLVFLFGVVLPFLR